MMLKTSSNSINPARGMFNLTLKRNIGITVMLVIAFLLICPSYMLIDLFGENRADAPVFKEYLSGWVYGFSIFCGIFAAISVTFLNLLNFSFMFKKNSSDFTDSLPLTRTELYFSKTLPSVILTLVPIICSLLSVGIVSVYFGIPSLWLDILVNFLYIFAITLVSSAFSMIFIVTAADVFDFLVSFAAINGGIIAIGVILCSICEQCLYGYNDSAYSSVLQIISPPFRVFLKFYEYIENENYKAISLDFFITAAIFIAVFTLISLLLYKKRKTENCSKAFAYKFMYYICSFIISFCGAYVFGELFSEGELSLLFFVFAVIGGGICAVIYGAITNRGFKTVKKSLTVSAVSFVTLAVIIFGTAFDITGFNKRIPEKSDIASVNVCIYGEDMTFNNPDIIMDIHKKAVENKNAYKEGALAESESYGLYLAYNLKNGKTMKRMYTVFTKDYKAEINAILKSEERFNSIEKMLNADLPATVDVYAPVKTDYQNVYLTLDETRKLIDIYKEEIKDKDISEMKDYKTVDINWGDGRRYKYVGLRYNDTFKKTLNYIDSLDLKDRIPKELDSEVIQYD